LQQEIGHIQVIYSERSAAVYVAGKKWPPNPWRNQLQASPFVCLRLRTTRSLWNK